MGHYYNPPSPFIGGRQPLAPAQLTPPSGPLPSNPPPLQRFPIETYAAWAPPVVIILPGPFVPIQPPNPPPPPFLDPVYRSWEVPPPAFQIARNTTPASGPVASNPPIRGSRVPDAVLVSWIPPPPMYQVRLPGAPPSGPVPSNPPRISGGLQTAISVAWMVASVVPFQMPKANAPPGGAGTRRTIRMSIGLNIGTDWTRGA